MGSTASNSSYVPEYSFTLDWAILFTIDPCRFLSIITKSSVFPPPILPSLLFKFSGNALTLSPYFRNSPTLELLLSEYPYSSSILATMNGGSSGNKSPNSFSIYLLSSEMRELASIKRVNFLYSWSDGVFKETKSFSWPFEVYWVEVLSKMGWVKIGMEDCKSCCAKRGLRFSWCCKNGFYAVDEFILD